MTEIAWANKPPNDFEDFIELYYQRCRKYVPAIEAMCGKWRYEDLLPGMSDFDTRFIYRDGMTVADWCDASMGLGRAHLEICREHSQWARILEHLPGINITWSEFFDPALYYPEYHQWTFYRYEDSARADQVAAYLAQRSWSTQDEFFSLKKFLIYFGRYDREIDPPINLGPFESKYPLHSRLMHYFTPPTQAAVSIITRKMICGKLEAVRVAKELFPGLKVLDELLNAVESHFEKPELYVSPGVDELEDRLEDALKFLGGELCKPGVVQAVYLPPNSDPKTWKPLLANAKTPVFLQVFDSVKWARQMKGRLSFYVQSPKHFEHTALISHELRRIGAMFCSVPCSIWAKLVGLDEQLPTEQIINSLQGDLLDESQVQAMQRFWTLTSQRYGESQYIPAAKQIIDVYDSFYHALYALVDAIGHKISDTSQT